MNKIAIIYTTFLRDNLMYKTTQSIINNMMSKCILFVGNQSYKTDENRLNGFSQFNIHINNPIHWEIAYYNLSFDCGLSYARNFLVEQARKINYDYCLVTADSLEFTQSLSDLYSIIEFMESNKNIGIVGLKINNRIKWTWNINLIPNLYFNLTTAKDKIKYKDLELIECQVVPNFFLAKTQCLLDNKWDNDLKLLEHEDFFYRLSKTDWRVYFNDSYSCNYIDDKRIEYKEMRDRMYTIFKEKLQKKYNIKGWIKEEK